jgi:carbonic anhydrase/acetyltransferase-like protein (isoleucine patch superfamily)
LASQLFLVGCILRYDFGDGNGLVEANFHRNGGGVVASTAKVDDSVFIDRESVIFGHARIKDRVRVVGHCRVSGELLPGGVSTLLEDDVIVSGNVVIEGHVLMRDKAQARNHTKLSGAVAMMHFAQAADRVTIAGQVQVCDHAYVHEDATIIGEKELIVLNLRDLLCGNMILRTMDDVNAFLGKSNKKRRLNRRANASDRSDERREETTVRRNSIMPTLEDLRSISMQSSMEPRVASA